MAKNNKSKKTAIEEKLLLIVTPRTVFGKKLKKLRKDGLVPANIYGSDFKSKAVSVKFKDFTQTYKTAKKTAVVYLKIDSKELPVLIKNIQRHPVDDNILHIDFRKIDLAQKIQTGVPIKLIGQSEAVNQKGGVLLTFTESLLIEALPIEIPKQIELDISSIKDIGQEIKVKDLKKSDKYEIKDPLDKVLASVVAHKEESVTPETAPVEAPEVITAAPVEEGTAPTEVAGKAPPASQSATGAKPSAATKPKPTKPSQPTKTQEGKK